MSFDNMCHVDELNLLKKKLALNTPFDEVWLLINKIIDPLHIKNHVRPQCKILYDPEKVRTAFPEANLMCAEQTFAWMGRYKKIFNSMPKTHLIERQLTTDTSGKRNKPNPTMSSKHVPLLLGVKECTL